MVFRSKKSESKESKKNAKKSAGISVFGVKLNVAQFATFLGVILGSIASSYYLGFFTGHSAGFQSAKDVGIATLPRMPIFADGRSLDNSGDESISTEIYAKLDSDKNEEIERVPNSKSNNTDKNVLELSKIPETKIEANEVPPGEASKIAVAPKEDIKVEEIEVPTLEAEKEIESEAKPSSATIVELGNKKENRETQNTTLGDLLNEREAEFKKNVAKDSKNVITSIESAVKEKKAYDETTPILDSTNPFVVKKEVTAQGQTEVAKMKTQEPVVEKKIEANRKVFESQKRVDSEDSETIVNTFNSKREAVTTETKKKIEELPELRKTSSNVSKGWYAQVAAPKTKEDANALIGKLRSAGFSATIETAEVRGEKYFRVVVGPEDSRETGERLVGQLKREGIVKGSDPFIRLIK